MKKDNEFEKFDRTMQELVKVPHDKVKAKLEEEKLAKAKKKFHGKNNKPEKKAKH